MNEDIENRTDMNTGKKWSQMDLLDLANCIRLNDPVEEIASFMCRSRREIREKIAELERSGELPGLIEKAMAEAGRPVPALTSAASCGLIQSRGTASGCGARGMFSC